MKNKHAFTLAEVLITLSIVGFIGMLTIPAMKNHSSEREYVTGVQKAYNVLQSATTAIETEHSDSSLWDNNKLKEYYQEVLTTSALPSSYSCRGVAVGSSECNISFSSSNSFMTNDGMVWQTVSTLNSKSVYVDINGEKEPNIMGVDIHQFNINDTQGVVPYGLTNMVIKKQQMQWLK